MDFRLFIEWERSFNLQQEEEFFQENNFYSSLKNKVVGDKEYEYVIKLHLKLKMRLIGDLNNLYNFQDTIILCEIF